jgi:hypothetical protein
MNLAPIGYHLFGQLEDSICGTKFTDDVALVIAVKEWLQNTRPEFYHEGIHVHVLK